MGAKYVPSLITEGITLVISPLISLMKNPVATLNQAFTPPVSTVR